MFSGVLVLVERSLRVDARAWAPHFVRFTLMAGIYFAVCYTVATSFAIGAPGLWFFRSIAYLDLVFMTLLGIAFFSSAITEEKEEDTLGLMLMAGINPVGILLGKSVGRLIQALLLIAVQYPFTLLAVTMGGITQNQVSSLYLSLFAYTIFLSGTGLLCSTLSHQNRTASFRMTLIVTVYFLIPWLCDRLSGTVFTQRSPILTILRGIADLSLFPQIGSILTSGFQESSVDIQVISNFAMGLVCYAFSWMLFGLAVRDLSADSGARGLTARSSSKFPLFSPGRPMLDPFFWKDFYFAGGGIAAIFVRTLLYAALFLVIQVSQGFYFGQLQNDEKYITGLFLVLMMFATSIDAGFLVARSIHDEIRGQTLAMLIMTPSTTGQILIAKTLGVLAVWLPAPFAIVLAIVCLPYGMDCCESFFRQPGAPFWLIAHLILVPHASALAATLIRWGALPVAIGASIGSGFLSGSFFNAIHANDNHPAVYLVALMVLGICGLCHVAVWLRVEALAAK